MSNLPCALADGELDHLSDLLRLLSDKTRLTIVLLLSRGERNVTSLCEELNLPQPTVSHHLGLLRNSSLVTNRRNGKQVFYVLNGRENHHKSELILPLEFIAARFNVKIDHRPE